MEAAAVADFRRDGYCVVRGLLPEPALAPVRALIDEYTDDRADALAADGHIIELCRNVPFAAKWSRIREQVADQSPKGPIGSTSNWGVPSPSGVVLLDERVHDMYCLPELTTLAAAILESVDVYGLGNFWKGLGSVCPNGFVCRC
jgi:hypothetical protein